MIYPYKCEHCQHEFDVVKSHTQMDDPETCEKCGQVSVRQFTARVHFIGTKVQEAEFNKGLGQVTRNKQHRDELAKQLGVVEIGNEKIDGDKMKAEKAKQRQKEWDAL